MTRPVSNSAIGLAILALSLSSAAEVQILPAGSFQSQDGRPKDAQHYFIDAQIAARLIEQLHARTGKVRFLIDYEHQTLNSEKNGQPAPAAGWATKFEWREGQGLYAVDVQWTERAKAMIDAKEYRYLSPVFRYRKVTGELLDLRMAAITNDPGLDSLTELAAAKFSEEEQPVNILSKAVLTALGLAETATEADATAAIATLKGSADKVSGLETEVAALKKSAGQEPDPTKFVPIAVVTDLQTKVAALTTDATNREIGELVTKALDEGKLLPAQEKWARDMGAKDLAALKSYLETAQPIAALTGTQTRGRREVPAAGGDPVAAAKAEFAGSAALRSEFPDEASYIAFKKAEAEGRVKVLGGRNQ